MQTAIVFLGLLIAISATYNAYILRGGKLAWSQVFIVFGMLSLVLSVILEIVYPSMTDLMGARVGDLLFILGFVFLLFASLKLRHSFK